jgi:hypothetical protein
VSADLSPSQSSLLVAMRHGVKVVMTFGEKRDRASLARPGFPAVTHSVLALERAGWVERFNVTAKGCEFRITDKTKDFYKRMLR